MRAKILSLNIGKPKAIEWAAKSISTSMQKSAVSQLHVHELAIDGDEFENKKHHGTPDAVLYAYGIDALDAYFQSLGLSYAHGDLGENLTLDLLDEREVSVGDKFKIGSVIAQATFPRIPCVKINFRLENPAGQKAMIEAGRSGVYFRILQPGVIHAGDSFERIEEATTKFTIFEVYERMVGGVKVSDWDRARVYSNGAFPMARIARWFPTPN